MRLSNDRATLVVDKINQDEKIGTEVEGEYNNTPIIAAAVPDV